MQAWWHDMSRTRQGGREVVVTRPYDIRGGGGGDASSTRRKLRWWRWW